MKKLLYNVRKPVFRSILLSYAVVCIAMLSIAGFGYSNSYQVLRRTTAKYGQQQAYTMAEQVNGRLAAVMKMLEVFSRKTILTEFAGYTDREISVNTMKMTVLQNEFSNVLITDTCSDFFIWFEKSQSMVGINKHRFNASLMPVFYKENGITAEEFQNAVNYEGIWSSYVFPDGRAWIMQTVYNEKYKRSAVLVAVMDFEKILKPMLYQDNENLLILSSEDMVFYASQDLPEDMASPALQDGESYNFALDGRKYFLTTRSLEEGGARLGWKCSVGIPEEILYGGVRIFWYMVFLELAGGVLLMVALSVWQTKRTYAPVKQLTEILYSGDQEGFQETYDNLIQNLKRLKEEHATLAEKEQQSFQREYAEKIRYILIGKIDDEAATGSVMKEWAGIDESDCWVMALIYMHDEADKLPYYGQYTDNAAALRSFVLKNVLDELLFCDYPGMITLIEDTYVLFVKALPEDMPAVTERLEKMRAFYQSALGTGTSVVAGHSQKGFAQIASEFRLVWNELRNAMFWMAEGEDSFVLRLWEDEGSEEPADLGASLEANRRLLNCLEAGDYQAAYDTLDHIFRETLPRQSRYLKYGIYRMYGLISTISMMLSVRSDSSDRQFWEGLNYEERLYNVKTVHQLMTVSRELFEAVIGYNADRERAGVPGWISGVEAYINANYTDMNLSVAAVADHFQLSVPHLSRTFKSAVGCGLLEYIQRLRVVRARELLDQGVNVSEAAQMAGYGEAKALRRAFKRYEGINPVEYRRNIRKGREEG